MFSKLGFPILTTYCGANFVPWWLGSFWYFLIDLIPGSSLALNCYAMYVRHFSLSDILQSVIHKKNHTHTHTPRKHTHTYTQTCFFLDVQSSGKYPFIQFHKQPWDANHVPVPRHCWKQNDCFHLFSSWKIKINRCFQIKSWHCDSNFNETGDVVGAAMRGY